MDFAFSEEQDMLRSAARDYLADRFPVERVVELAESEAGWDPATWPELANLGWLGLSVPEADGGAGMGFLDEAVLFEETGAALLPGPLFSTVGLALPALRGDSLAAVLAGERSATLAFAEQGGPVSLAEAARGATTADAAGRLTGTKRWVTDLGSVDDVVVTAHGPAGLALYRVDLREQPGTVARRTTLDATRRLGDLTLAETPAELLADGDEAAAVLRQVRLRALAALACEGAGVAARALEISAAYAGQRQQFGRVIGTYQGVSHRIANIYVSTELARSLAYWAAWTVSVGDEQADVATAAAKSAAGEAAVFATENAIQAMGGIGFTWDHPLHRYYKRAQGIDAFEGFGREHRAGIAATLLDGDAGRLLATA